MSTLADDEAFLMVNLCGRTSGLPMNVWIGPKHGARHAARIKVQMDHRERFDPGNLAVVSMADPPEVVEGHLGATDLAEVRRYIAPQPRCHSRSLGGADRRRRAYPRAAATVLKLCSRNYSPA